MTRKRKNPPKGTTHCSPAVKAAKSLKRKYGNTGGVSPGKSIRARRAILDVQEEKSSIRKAAEKHSVSVSFLRRRLSGEVPLDSRNGPSPVFNKKEEETMATWLKEMAERGLGLRPGEFLDFVQEIVQKEKRKTPFVNDRPSYKWYGNFMERNKSIVQIRIETPLEASRSKLTRKAIDSWYCNYRDFLIKYGLLHKPNCIYNADETGFSMSSKAGKVIGPARINQNTSVPHVSGRSKERITVMFCGCADGSMIPPFLVYREPRPRSYNPLTGGITGSDITYTKKGWMNSVAYEDFLEHFNKYAVKDRPIVLLIDSVSSHISMNAFESAKKNDILLYRLVPNATHLMQPLDKGVFGPLKQRWYQVTRAHTRNHPGVAIGKEIFSEKLKEAYLLFYKPLTVLNSFKSSGIYPVDSTVITDENLKPGLTYTHSDDETGESSKSQPTKCSQEELEAQGALRAFERALCTPTRQKYIKRIEEGYDIVGQSPCFDVYKNLKSASEGRASTSRYDKAPETSTVTSVSEESPQMSTVKQSGLDILASAALQKREQMTSSDKTERKSDSVVSPVILESIVMPKSAKPKKLPPRRLVHDLPHHLTSNESVRTMALRDLSKVKVLAEKEKRAKKKFLASIQKLSASSKIKTIKSKDTIKTKRMQKTKAKTKAGKSSEKFEEIASSSRNIYTPDREETSDDNENVECKGCRMTWSEDQELGLGRTWVNCDVCNMWMHYDCSSREVDSDEPFCCPDYPSDQPFTQLKNKESPSVTPPTDDGFEENTTRPWLLLLLIFVTAIGLLTLVYFSFPQLDQDELQYMKLPKNIEDAKNLGRVLSRYKDSYYTQVLTGFFVTYIFLQSFAIPGSIFLSILSGFLFPFPLALFLVCFCSGIGATFCYLLSYLVGRRLVKKYIPERVKDWQGHVNNHKDHLLNYILFLRITPFLPNWFINIASPVINVPLLPFFIGTFLGVAPPSFVAIQAGTTLHQLTSSGDAISFKSVIVLGLFAVVSLLPVLLKNKLKKKFE